jgi:Rne/Rng family ribonuclease
VRTAAAGASDEELRADIHFLKNLWSEIKTRSESSKSPALIYHDLNVVERVLRDQVSSDFSVIWVDTEQEYERIVRFANRFQPGLVKRVKLYTKETPLYEQFGLNEEINKALKSKVWLKSGGYIVINQTEALVAIDVNTGKYVGKRDLEETILKINLEAVGEIVRQIRLRDLGGIIIIDFIDMDREDHRGQVFRALTRALGDDKSRTNVLEISELGLVEMTRKRVRQSLHSLLMQSCPTCKGTGVVKSAAALTAEIYRKIQVATRDISGQEVLIRVNPDLSAYLQEEESEGLEILQRRIQRKVTVQGVQGLHKDEYEIITR